MSESSGDELVYYVEATEDRTATCAPCGNTLAGSFAVGAIALTVVAFIVLLVLFARLLRDDYEKRTISKLNPRQGLNLSCEYRPAFEKNTVLPLGVEAHVVAPRHAALHLRRPHVYDRSAREP